MKVKLLQLNIESGRFLDQIIAYVRKQDFDILHFQEVSGSTFNRYHKLDMFEVIKQKLDCDGVLTKTVTHSLDKNSYFGKAIFFKKNFKLLSRNEIWLKPFKVLKTFPKTSEEIKQLPHNALDVVLERKKKVFIVLRLI